MEHVDGFVTAVPTANREKFQAHLEYSAAVFKDLGAMKVVDGRGDDVPDGKLTSLPKAVQKKDNETICFSWIVWPSKEARDAGMKKVFADERMKPENNPMPFDGKRLIDSGFETSFETGKAIRGITPCLQVRNTDKALAWYERGFDATEVRTRLVAPDGTCMNVEIEIEGTRLM